MGKCLITLTLPLSPFDPRGLQIQTLILMLLSQLPNFGFTCIRQDHNPIQSPIEL